MSAAPQLARILRVLRVSRILRIAGHYKGLQSLFNTIMLSVSALFNVFMLLMLFFFVLATLGQFMFGGVTTGDVINEYKNFGVFDTSFLLLFSISTGEDWNAIMYDCSHVPPDCIPGETCGSPYAYAYFISFILLVTYVMLNLFILVIIQQFQKLYLDSEGSLQKFNRANEVVVASWIRFTEKHHCIKLNAKFIYDFMKAIPAPLGFSDMSGDELKKYVLKLNIKEEDGWIFFNELLYRILRNSYGRFNLNKNMQIRELITQYKLFNLTMSHIKLGKKKNLKERFMKKVGADCSDTVNPFLTQMYYRISFLTWSNVMRKWRQEQEVAALRAARQKRNKELGLDTYETESDSQRPESPDFEVVEIEVEHYSEWSCTSEED